MYYDKNWRKIDKRKDWLTLGEDGEVEMEDYFMPVAEVTGLGNRHRDESEEEIKKNEGQPKGWDWEEDWENYENGIFLSLQSW